MSLNQCITNLTTSTSKLYFLGMVKSVNDHSSPHYQKFDVNTTAIICT